MRRLAVAALMVGLLIAGCGGGSGSSQSETDEAMAAAQTAFQQAKSSGTDLDRGPCIAEQLPGLPDWAADVAHQPRQPVDNDPANQCTSYRSGQTHHFVELAPDGQIIKAQ
jgi:hypothetical protein